MSKIDKLLAYIAENGMIECAYSLPIYNEKKHIIFSYTTKLIDGQKYINQVYRVYCQDEESGVITEQNMVKISDIQLADYHDGLVKITLDLDTLLDLEEEYLLCYDEFVDIDFKASLNEADKMVINRIYDCLCKLENNDYLRNVYRIIGKDMFEYIDRQRIH